MVEVFCLISKWLENGLGFQPQSRAVSHENASALGLNLKLETSLATVYTDVVLVLVLISRVSSFVLVFNIVVVMLVLIMRRQLLQQQHYVCC